MPDDGSGKTTVWVIRNLEKELVDKNKFGQFYSGDSYVILYEYKNKAGKTASIIYFWQGLESTQDEKSAAAILADQLGKGHFLF